MGSTLAPQKGPAIGTATTAPAFDVCVLVTASVLIPHAAPVSLRTYGWGTGVPPSMPPESS